MMRNQGRPPDISNMDFILAKFPQSDHEVECLLILGTYVELVDREVVLKQKDLMVNTLIGVLQAKSVSARSRAVPQTHIALPWRTVALDLIKTVILFILVFQY